MSRPAILLFLYGLIFLSGVCALGSEMVWARMFGLQLGHELPGVLAVIMAFLAGLALGGWSLDPRLSRSRRPPLWYGALELISGGWILGTILLIPAAGETVHHWTGPAPGPLRSWLIAFGLPFLLLLPATVSMGAALPAMERWMAPLSSSRRCVAGLYAAQTLGAVAGIGLAIRLIIPAWGFSATLGLLGSISLACGTLALAAGARAASEDLGRSSPPTPAAPPLKAPALLFVTGLLGLGYEVVGIRALSQVLEGTVYTFAAALAVFLLGTSAGAALYQSKGGSYPERSIRVFLLTGLSLTTLAGTLALSAALDTYQTAGSLLGESEAAGILAELLVAATVFAPATMFMGATWSHLVQSERGPGGGVGRALAVNTLGAALAPPAFGALLVPLCGIKWSLAVLLGGYLLLLPGGSWRYRIGGAGAAALLLAWLPPALPPVPAPGEARLLFDRPAPLATVAVLEYPGGHRSLRVDGHFLMGGTSSAGAERRQAHLPLLLHPKPETVLFLGVGTGITLGTVEVYPELQADAVELIPEILTLLPYFEDYNGAAHRNPRIRLYPGDARRFVRASRSAYDVIVADLFHPARDGAGGLYTVEHFQAVRRRLAPGGLFCQWLSLFQLDEPLLKSITAAFLEVFPQVSAYLLRPNVDTPVMGLVGFLKPLPHGLGWLGGRVQSEALAEQLRELAIADDLQLFGHLLAGPGQLRRFSEGAPLNRDDHPLVTFGAPALTYREANSYGRLLHLVEGQAKAGEEPIDARRHPEFAASLRNFLEARRLYLHGLVEETEGDREAALELYLQGVAVSADFPSAYARCLLLAWQWAQTDAARARSLLRRLEELRPERPLAGRLLESLEQP